MTDQKSKQPLSDLLKRIQQLESVAVAFSGGVDSSLLAYATHSVLSEKMLAISINTPYIPDWEIEEAKAFTAKHGIPHHVIDLEVPSTIKKNPSNRCYLCKQIIFNTIIKHARKSGFKTIIEGSNKDDLRDYRPGMKALQELKIISPFLDLEITKDEIRKMSKDLNLETWDKPAYACLLSRIPYDTEITPEELQKINAAEEVLRHFQIKGSRVRSHDSIARIEVPLEEFETILKKEIRTELIRKIKACGYLYVTLDLEGYTTGSLNRTIWE